MDELISCASWPDVRKHGDLKSKPKRTKGSVLSSDDIARVARKSKLGIADDDAANERSLRKHLTEVREMRESRRRCLAAVKASYRNQFRQGLLSRQALHFLENLTEKMIDNDCQMNEWESIAEQHLFSRVKRRSTKCLRIVFKRWDFELLQFGYDVVCGFYHARHEALHSIEVILGADSAAFHHLRSIISDDQEIAKRTILEVQRYLPEIAANIATLRAARSMLNVQRFTASQLYEEGFLDKLEHTRILHMIEQKMHHIQVNPPEIDMPSKHDLIKEISWLSGAPQDMVKEISDLAVEHMVDEGEMIIKQGEMSNNMFLIARGTCTVVDENNGGEMEVLSEIGVGSLIGDISWLNNQPRSATVMAASRGLVYSLNGKEMKSILNRETLMYSTNHSERRSLGKTFRISLRSGRDLEKESGSVFDKQKNDLAEKRNKAKKIKAKKINSTIKKKLWQSAGLKLSENLLRYEEPYNTWEKPELRRWLMQWILFIPDETSSRAEIVRPCILVDGKVQLPWQETCGEEYESPKYLKPGDGQPMKLLLLKGAKIFCPPGAIKKSQATEKMERRTSIDGALFQKAGWKLIKQKMVDEKKGGWGKLAIDLKGAVAKEKEAKDAAKAKVITLEKRGNSNYLSEGFHQRIAGDNNHPQSPTTSPNPTKFKKEKTFKSAAINPIAGGSSGNALIPLESEDGAEAMRPPSASLTPKSKLEQPDLHRPGRRIMKELSFKQKVSADGSSLDSLVTSDNVKSKVGAITKAVMALKRPGTVPEESE